MPSSLGADPWSSVMLGAAPVNIAGPGISAMPTAGSLTDRRSTKEKDSWVCFVWLAGPVKKEKIIMKKNTKNTVKFGKVMEIITKAKFNLMTGKPVSLKVLQEIEEKIEYLYGQYKNYVAPAAKANKQLGYLKYKQFIEGKK